MGENDSDYWIFVTSFYPNIEWEGIGLDKFDVEKGSVRLLNDRDPHGRRIFLVGVEGGGISKKDDGAEKAREVLRYFIGMIYLAGGGLEINHDFHQHSKLNKEEYNRLKELSQGEGSLDQFFDEVEFIHPRDHERRFVYAADRFAQQYLMELQPMLRKFLNDPRVSDDHKEFVITVLGLSYNRKLAGTRRQQFISGYTAVDLLVKRVGRGGSTAESLDSMKDKFIENDVFDESKVSMLINAIDHFHNVRSGIYFGGKKPEDYSPEDFPGELVPMPGGLIGNLLLGYISYYGKKAERGES